LASFIRISFVLLPCLVSQQIQFELMGTVSGAWLMQMEIILVFLTHQDFRRGGDNQQTSIVSKVSIIII
jgi:hypothetical protein